ncbi:TPA: hypothetical protein DCR49_01840, partial [Candidatus Delongbacteria bacterium]|nr:hypothetical protein [Candidatus Delongbacteria bacterium]
MKRDGEESKAKITGATFKRILVFFKGHTKALIFATLTVVLGVSLNAALPLVFREMIDKAIPEATKSGILDKVLVFALAYLSILILLGAIQYFQQLVIGYMGIDIVN